LAVAGEEEYIIFGEGGDMAFGPRYRPGGVLKYKKRERE
jgi:hypothetical protein